VCGTVSESGTLPVLRKAPGPDGIWWIEEVALRNVNFGSRWISMSA